MDLWTLGDKNINTDFEDILSEQSLVLLTVFLVNGGTESREVDKSISGNLHNTHIIICSRNVKIVLSLVGQIQDFLLKGV